MFSKHLALALCLATCAVATAPAQATTIVKNGDFTGAKDLKGVPMPAVFGIGHGSYFTDFAWEDTGNASLDWIAPNGTADGSVRAPANPAGYTGNVYVADASPQYNVGTYLNQTLNGLITGQSYTLTFLQAAGDYYLGHSDTAQWSVGFGGALTYSDTAPGNWVLSGATTQLSTVMNIDPTTGTSPWVSQSMTFKASGISELLSFFATGSGAPPFALLADVSVVPAVPEPATWLTMILGFGMIGFVLRRGRSGDIAAASAA